jgi:hypothetical protein
VNHSIEQRLSIDLHGVSYQFLDKKFFGELLGQIVVQLSMGVVAEPATLCQDLDSLK